MSSPFYSQVTVGREVSTPGVMFGVEGVHGKIYTLLVVDILVCLDPSLGSGGGVPKH